MKSARLGRSRRRSAAGDGQNSIAGAAPIAGPECSRLRAERVGLQARIDAIEPLCAKWTTLVQLNQADASAVVELEARFGALASHASLASIERAFGHVGGLGQARGALAEAQTSYRKARLDDVEKLRVRADVLSLSIAERSDQLDVLARRIDNARATLAPRIEHWNGASERSQCVGPHLDLYPTVWPSFAQWSQRDNTAEPSEHALDPDLTDDQCENLLDEINQHNRRVAYATLENRNRLDELADLEGKLETLRVLAADIQAQWRGVKNELVWRDKMWAEGDNSGRVLSTTGLAIVLGAPRVSIGAGFGEALFELSNRHCALQAQIHSALGRLNNRASRLGDEIRGVAEALRSQAIELERKKRSCGLSDRAPATTVPAIDRLSVAPTGANRWFRAQKHLQWGGVGNLTAEQITCGLRNARTW